MTLRVIDETHCESSHFESDAYIPFSAAWKVGGTEIPLYWRASGRHGGEIEVKIDPKTKALREVIVLEPPPPLTAKEPHNKVSILENFTAIVDISPWGLYETPDYSRPAQRIAETVEEMFFGPVEGGFRLEFSQEDANKALKCGPLLVEVSESGSLVAVTALSGKE